LYISSSTPSPSTHSFRAIHTCSRFHIQENMCVCEPSTLTGGPPQTMAVSDSGV
jgi:hypothetical protein